MPPRSYPDKAHRSRRELQCTPRDSWCLDGRIAPRRDRAMRPRGHTAAHPCMCPHQSHPNRLLRARARRTYPHGSSGAMRAPVHLHPCGPGTAPAVHPGSHKPTGSAPRPRTRPSPAAVQAMTPGPRPRTASTPASGGGASCRRAQCGMRRCSTASAQSFLSSRARPRSSLPSASQPASTSTPPLLSLIRAARVSAPPLPPFTAQLPCAADLLDPAFPFVTSRTGHKLDASGDACPSIRRRQRAEHCSQYTPRTRALKRSARCSRRSARRTAARRLLVRTHPPYRSHPQAPRPAAADCAGGCRHRQ